MVMLLWCLLIVFVTLAPPFQTKSRAELELASSGYLANPKQIPLPWSTAL
jgi:hypothetical protein